MVSKRIHSNTLVYKRIVSTSNSHKISPSSKFFSSVFDMVNVHLFHDASNLLAAAESPSVYSQFRKNALEHTLKKYKHAFMSAIDAFLCRRLPLDPSERSVPFAIFGDFNFRLDAHRLLEVNPKRSSVHVNDAVSLS